MNLLSCHVSHPGQERLNFKGLTRDQSGIDKGIRDRSKSWVEVLCTLSKLQGQLITAQVVTAQASG